MNPQKTPLVEIDQVKDIFGQPPGWMLYWGGTVVFGLVLLLLGLAAWIRYPDEVAVPVQLTTETPPIQAMTTIDEKVAEILVAEGAAVQDGQVLIRLQSVADFQAMQQLDQLLDQLEPLSYPTDILSANLPENLALGELRTAYAELLNYTTELRYWLQRNQSGQRAQRIDQQLQQMATADTALRTQEETLQEELAIAERNLEEYQKLLDSGAGYQLEVDQARTAFLRARRQLEEHENRVLRNQMDRESLELEKLRLSENLSDQITEQWLGLRRQVRSLRQGLHDWEERYLIKAPATGRLVFPYALTPGQFLPEGTVVASILPESGSATVMAEGAVGSEALGKIGEGSTAQIQLDAYPYREFGQLVATISYIGDAPLPSLASSTDPTQYYRLELQLANGLTTSYDRTISFRQQMQGTAFILSEDRSILGRLLDRLRDIRERRL